MSGKGLRTGHIVLLSLLMLLPSLFLAGPQTAEGGPAWGPGLDIAVVEISSHSDHGAITLTDQVVIAKVVNSGTFNYTFPVNATLQVTYMLNGTIETPFFNSTEQLGTVLEGPGNVTNVTFPSWKPTSVGTYWIKVSVDALDSHTQNNSIRISVTAMAGTPAGVKVGVDIPSKLLNIGNSTMDTIDPYIFSIKNTGPLVDSFKIAITSQWVVKGWTNKTRDLAPGEVQYMSVHVKVPDTASAYDFDVLVFNATSTKNDTISDWISVNTSIPKKAGVSVSVIYGDPQRAYPGGEWVSFLFRVTNIGDMADHFTMTPSSRPSRWEVRMDEQYRGPTSIPGSYSLLKGIPNYANVIAEIKIPPLVFETMEEDSMLWGDTGALIITATGEKTGVTGSGEGTVYVGLVHTVQLKVSPPNATIPFIKGSGQTVNFNVEVRSVNNIKGGTGMDMDVNLTLPDGPTGVMFIPVWSLSANKTESLRWVAAVPTGILQLRGGQWSQGQLLVVNAPIFPIQGTAFIKLEAVPMINVSLDGLAIPQSVTVNVTVGPYLDFTLEPPKTEFFDNKSLMDDDDRDQNGLEDWREGAPGDVLLLPFNITNLGNGWDKYNAQVALTVQEGGSTSPGQWGLTFTPLTRMVLPFWFDPRSPSTSVLVWVKLVVPAGAPIGESVNISMRAVSVSDLQYNPDSPLERRAYTTVHVKQGFVLDLEPEVSSAVAEPGETVTYFLNITNNGNGLDDVSLILLGNIPADWTIELDTSSVSLLPLQRSGIALRVAPGQYSPRDTVLSLRVRAFSRISKLAFDEVWANTTVSYKGASTIELVSELDVLWKYPGETADFAVDVRNVGNGNDSFDIDVSLGAPGWVARIKDGETVSEVMTAQIPMGGVRRFEVLITLPSLREIYSYDDLLTQKLIAGSVVSSFVSVRPQGYTEANSTLELAVGVLKEHRASITLISGSVSRDVLPGDTAYFQFNIQNTGNAEDPLRARASSRNGSARHDAWTQVDSAPYRLAPFGDRTLNLTITPRKEDSPAYHEVVEAVVEALAGDNITYWRTSVSVRVVMAVLASQDLFLDLGTEGDLVFRLCNMPDPGETVVPDWPMNKPYRITTALTSIDSSGWNVNRPNALVNLTIAYETVEVRVPISAPVDLVTGTPFARVESSIYGGPSKEELLTVFARAVYFDVYIDLDRTTFRNLYEGGKGKAVINVVVIGTRGQDPVPLELRIGDSVYHGAIPRADPQQYVGSTQEFLVEFDFELPSLDWHQKSREMRLVIVLDPDDDVNENTIEGKSYSEDNNVMTKEFMIMNSTPPTLVLWFSGVVLVLLLAAGITGYFFIERRNSWFMVALSCGLVGAFSLLFFLPLERTEWGAGAANEVGLMVIALDLFLLVPAMAYLFTKVGDCHILYRMNEGRDKRIEGGLEEVRLLAVPYLVSFTGGVAMGLVPVFFWAIYSELDEGVSGVIDVLLGKGSSFPVLVIIIGVPLMCLALQSVLMFFKLRALRGIGRTWDQLERLRTEIGEGLE